LGEEGAPVLPAAYGSDLGLIWKPIPRLVSSLALWYLFLEQEFVYVGDAGIVEPSGRSRRVGVDVGLRYQLFDWLFADIDGNYAFARSIDEPEGAQHIPLAPVLTATGGLSMRKGDFTAGIQARFMRDRPANEENNIIAKGYFITDLNAGYKWRNIIFGIRIDNLFNQEWNETQFATTSRLRNEQVPIEEIHFTPGTPFFFKGNIRYSF
jgi:outer membrane receptor protein involved in Fe transport